MNRVTAKAAILVLLSAGSIVQAQQADPRQILNGMIYQVQTGKPNPNWYGVELWQLIAYQTGNTGVYPQLAQLGPVRDITVNQELPLPDGVLYSMTAQHTRGTSYWEFGIGRLTNRIEYASFRTGPRLTESPAFPGPLVEPEPAQSPRPSPAAPSAPGGTQEACRKFPNLCG